MTAKDIALAILALPEEQQNVPLIFEYYVENESSVPIAAVFESIRFHDWGFPIKEPHIALES